MTCVLVVDGDRSASAAIQALLELEGFEVVVADGGHSGLRAIESSAFDAVIIDVLVPWVDGLDAIKAVHERAPMVPIIAIAPHKFRDCLGPERDFLGLATNLGAAAALYKPFMPRDLVTAVATCIDDRSRTRALARTHNVVAGLDPATHPHAKKMDPRVKPAGDAGEGTAGLSDARSAAIATSTTRCAPGRPSSWRRASW